MHEGSLSNKMVNAMIEEPNQIEQEASTATKPIEENPTSTLKTIEVTNNTEPSEDHQTQSPKPKRRKHRRPSSPEYLSLEMVLRKSLWDCLKEYLQHCSLAGARQMCDPELGWLERFFWSLVFCTALATICYFLQYIWSDTLTRPLIVNMESTTYPISSIDFPAVAICNINRINKRALRQFAMDEYKDLATNNESLEAVESALVNWGRLINFSYNESLRTNSLFNRIIAKYRSFDNQRIVQIMQMLAPSCEEMLLRCAWAGTTMDCNRLFTMHRIVNRGHCCTFNYWSRMQKVPVKRQEEPGFLYGLNVLLDPLIDDYTYPLTAMLGFDVLILDPAHAADPSSGRVIQKIGEPNMAVFMQLRSTKQIATEEVRSYAVTTRNCLFQDESTRSSLYSYSTCIMYCKLETVFSLCKCSPYFYTEALQKGPVCTLENLICLNKYKEKLNYFYPKGVVDKRGLEVEFQNSLFCPSCYPDCELTQYYTKSNEIPIGSPFEEKEIKGTFLADIDPTNKTFLSIYHPLPDANLDKLDVVYYWFEILSNIGGFCGMIIGFSFISAVELFYFLSIRFIANIYNNYQKYHA